MAYTIGETTAKPFWAKSADFIGGRDPLGIQNSSVSVYTRLLPGLNNVTERLRYYGFYCWILNRIHEKNIVFQTYRDQYNFIRKAEYSIALYMAINEPKVGTVAGIDYANKVLQRNPGIELIDVKAGAEKYPETRKGSVYWDFTSGAMGKYYAGSLLTLGLIKTKNKYFFVTDSGIKLAQAFNKSISKESEELLFRVIETGSLKVSESALLRDFAPTGIQPGSAEYLFYCEMFFSADLFETYTSTDEKTFFRLKSFQIFIDYLLQCNDTKPWLSFPKYIYDARGFIDQENESKSSVGWFYYYTNELIHFALESIFCATILTIESQIMDVNDVVQNLYDQTINALDEEYSLGNDSKLGDVILAISQKGKTTSYPDQLSKFAHEKNIQQILQLSFELLFNVYSDTLPYCEMFSTFTKETETRDKNGTALDFFEKDIKSNLHNSISVFIKRIISKVINDHLYISYLKMGNGEGQVHKFIVEDNFLVHIATVYPRFTSPRLQTVKNFLHDLKLIRLNKENRFELSEIGELVYQQYK
jgi:hypothetical protein